MDPTNETETLSPDISTHVPARKRKMGTGAEEDPIELSDSARPELGPTELTIAMLNFSLEILKLEESFSLVQTRLRELEPSYSRFNPEQMKQLQNYKKYQCDHMSGVLMAGLQSFHLPATTP